MRWLFHVVRKEELVWSSEGRYAPPSLTLEGFLHASYKESVHASAALYFKSTEPSSLTVLAIDPRRLDVTIEEASTPRGPMPHIHGSLPRDAVRELDLLSVSEHPSEVKGTRLAFLAFDGMTLLDLVGPLDALSRIATMGFDSTTTCEVIAITRRSDAHPGEPLRVWSAFGATLTAARYRPPLEEFDVVIVPGGPGTTALEDDPSALAWVAEFPENRILASVCTGSLLLGAAGRLRGKRATTHLTKMNELARFGATCMPLRVVDEGQLVTAGGVTSGIDLGLHLVKRLAGNDAFEKIALQMQVSEVLNHRA